MMLLLSGVSPSKHIGIQPDSPCNCSLSLPARVCSSIWRNCLKAIALFQPGTAQFGRVDGTPNCSEVKYFLGRESSCAGKRRGPHHFKARNAELRNLDDPENQRAT